MDDSTRVVEDFHEAVNMAPAEIEHWLATEESRAVGSTPEGASESVGHHSGRRIVEILRKSKRDYTNGDIEHMRKVVGYVHRHLAQRPDGDVTETRWAYSLKNWGHDPTKH